MNIYVPGAGRSWAKLFLTAAFLYLLNEVSAIFLPVVLAVVLAFVLYPLVLRLERLPLGSRRIFMPRFVAILASFFILGFVGFFLGSFLLVPLFNELNKFLVSLPELAEKFRLLTAFLNEENNIQLPSSVQGLIDQALSGAAAFSIDLLKRVVRSSILFATGLIEFVVVPVLTFYFLKDWRLLADNFIRYFPDASHARVNATLFEIGRVVSSYIRGQVIVSLIIGGLVTVGIYVIGVDYPLVLGVLAMLTEAIPVVGPIVGAVPAIFLAYLLSPVLAVKVTVFYLIIHQLENHIIVPTVMGESINLHPVSIIISLLIGAQLLGILGMIFAVPVAAIINVLLEQFWFSEDERDD